MTDSVTYYRHVKPVAPPLPLNSEVYGFEHRSFLIVRRDSNYMLWSIENLDHTKPPLALRSSFTTKQKAMEKIDNFLAEENLKLQNENDTRNNS